MRRALRAIGARAYLHAAACLLACLALPAASPAQTPGYTPIGPPASLRSFAFATDGTVYGTVGGPFDDELPSDPVLWRSTDHGRTWSARYRAPTGSQLNVLEVSPVDAGTVYVNLVRPRGGTEIARIDANTGRVVPFPFWRFLGADAAGTAYGLTSHPRVPPAPLPSYGVVRCLRTADACSEVPATSDAFHAVVDTLSVGVLAMTTRTDAGQQVQTSTDGGATWAAGALASPGACYCPLAFAGPAPRTLYSIAGGNVSVSHDAGLTWAATHPAPPGDGPIVGSRPAAVLSDSDGPPALTSLSFSADEGATYVTVPLPGPAGVAGVDPTDIRHLFLVDAVGTAQSWDAGQTASSLADARFGIRALTASTTTGAGRNIYSALGDTIFSSGDLGATWTTMQRPYLRPSGLRVSRDDPRSAYVLTDLPRQELRTRDGGKNWEAIPNPLAAQIAGIVPGSADHVFFSTNDSTDGGVTWAPLETSCWLAARDDPTSPTGMRIACAHYAEDGSIASMSPVTPWASGLFASPDLPGAFAVAIGDLLGDIGAGGAWTPLLAPTSIFGPVPPDARPLSAWPAKDGTTFYAGDSHSGVTWVRRGTGRWWRLQAAGTGLGLVSVLDGTHALVALPGQGRPLGVLDLSRPVVEEPHVEVQSGGLTCAVPWSRADADTTAYAWLRDGAALRGATGLQYRPTPLDRGHDVTCRATATTSWGSVAVDSSLPYRVPGARVDPPRPRLTGTPLAGNRLTCSARTQITWLRDGRAVPGRHARSYRVGSLDRGHGIVCRTQLGDGTLVQSRAVRIP